MRPGLGFYKYSFNDIDRKNTSFGNSESRNINFVSPLLIPYFTDKYWYNSIALNLGIENDFPIFRDCQVRLATDIKNYITFSQSYHLTTNPDGSKNFNKNDTKYYGISLLATAGLIKRFKKISVGPSVIVPIFDGWRTDQAFPQETGKDTRNKFFGGVGFGIVFNYSWNKINHK